MAPANLVIHLSSGGYRGGIVVRSEIYFSLERAGDEAYALNVTMTGVVLLALNAGLFGWYYCFSFLAYSLSQAMETVFTCNLAAAGVISLLALRSMPRLVNNLRDNLLLGLSCAYLMALLALNGAHAFESLGAYQLVVVFTSVLCMLAVPLTVIISAEEGVTVNLVVSVHERL